MTQGIHAMITDGSTVKMDVLLIGLGVPRLHSADSLPVYQVVEHEQGMPVVTKGGLLLNLLAYPSHWPGPGKISRDWLWAEHENLPWQAMIPCHDEE